MARPAAVRFNQADRRGWVETAFVIPRRRNSVPDSLRLDRPLLISMGGFAVRILFALFSTRASPENVSRLDSYAILKYSIEGSNFRQIGLVPLLSACFSR